MSAAAALLATLGVGVSIAAMAAFAHLVLGLDLSKAVLLGAITAPTDSAAVFSVLRKVPAPGRLRAILEGESGAQRLRVVLLTVARNRRGRWASQCTVAPSSWSV